MKHVPYPKTRTQITTAVAVVCAMGTGVVLTLHRPPQPAPSRPPVVITYSTDTPDEVKPPADYVWSGLADDPKWISLPSIDAEGYIQQVGIDQYKQVAVPNNVHMAGWFVSTVRPGQKGLSVIDGHVDGRATNEGIFRNLHSLKPGDTYSVTLGSGYKIYYRVMSVTTVPLDDAASTLFSQDPRVASQLNLITCTGTYNSDAKTYDKRVVVTSTVITPAGERT